ncbi:MAG: 3-phosphoshikimate 1-carboxyvinyltransferase [Pseudomonadota bacterium]
MQAMRQETAMQALRAAPAARLGGRLHVPGDKSISHRALMLGLASLGETRIEGLLEGADVLATARAIAALGADVTHHGEGRWSVHGVGLAALAEPAQILDMGNSGTAARLLMGLVASHPISATFTGDASLSARPMDRVVIPLTRIGAQFSGRAGNRLPLTVTGAAEPIAIRYRLPMASAQVKSAVLLAALNAPGTTIVEEPLPSRDHSERMLQAFGAAIVLEEAKAGRIIALTGERELMAPAAPLMVPGDPSSAAFPIVAALIVPGSDILIEGVGTNPTRSGLFTVLKAMGGDIRFLNERLVAGEPVADIAVQASALQGVEVPPEIAPTMIDEYPVLAVAAALAQGRTHMAGIKELRVKETDRIAAMAAGLRACGVEVEETQDSLTVHGKGAGSVPGGARIISHYDHRIAMSFAVLGQASRKPIVIDDITAVATSFPGFVALMRRLGAALD